jgi:hypothetical protein
MRALAASVLAATLAIAVAGCGSSSSAKGTSAAATSATSPTTTASTTSSSGPGALQAEVKSAATGDIPDNQAFVVFADPAGGYSMKYPEGWAQSGGGKRVVIRDKNNIIRVVVAPGTLPAAAAVRSQVAGIPGVGLVHPPQAMTLPSGRAVKVVYSTRSAPSPVTGKRVTLVVDRYYVARGGKLAIVDLGTPEGVDNVDAYRLMIESLRWR